MMGSGVLWMGLSLLVLWVFVAYAIRWAVGPRGDISGPDALELLDARLAQGEITTEEYRRVRQLLTTGH